MLRLILIVLSILEIVAFSPPAAAQAKVDCRMPNGANDSGWIIVRSTSTDLTSLPGYNYEIVRDYIPSRPMPLEIRLRDRFVVTSASDDRLLLVHQRQHALKGYRAIAESALTLDSSGLWARGPALHGTLGQVGEYVIYKLKDSGTQGGATTCKHSKHAQDGNTGVCRSLLIEYFDDYDAANFPKKPEHNTNVFEGILSTKCVRPIAETDEGDGDHGPD